MSAGRFRPLFQVIAHKLEGSGVTTGEIDAFPGKIERAMRFDLIPSEKAWDKGLRNLHLSSREPLTASTKDSVSCDVGDRQVTTSQTCVGDHRRV